jgi:hypothetical protein
LNKKFHLNFFSILQIALLTKTLSTLVI